MDLPRLPGQYLAEVYAALKLGQPEEGFHFAPGILYMASQVGTSNGPSPTNSSHRFTSAPLYRRATSHPMALLAAHITLCTTTNTAHAVYFPQCPPAFAVQLRKRANSSSTPLLSLDVDTVLPGALTITAAHEVVPGVPGSQGPGAGAGGPLPKLKVRRLAAGTIEISLRQVGCVHRGGPGELLVVLLVRR